MTIKIHQLTLLIAAATTASLLSANSPAPLAGSATPTIALATRQRPTHRCTDLTPSSQLTRFEANFLANALGLMKGKDIIVSNVAATGSMRPYFDENALLLLEAVPFSELKLGDVVTFSHPRLNVEVVHRLLEKRGGVFWSKGDHNGAMDDIYVTPANYHRRLVGVIYFQPEAKAGPQEAKDAPALAASAQPRRPRN